MEPGLVEAAGRWWFFLDFVVVVRPLGKCRSVDGSDVGASPDQRFARPVSLEFPAPRLIGRKGERDGAGSVEAAGRWFFVGFFPPDRLENVGQWTVQMLVLSPGQCLAQPVSLEFPAPRRLHRDRKERKERDGAWLGRQWRMLGAGFCFCFWVFCPTAWKM